MKIVLTIPEIIIQCIGQVLKYVIIRGKLANMITHIEFIPFTDSDVAMIKGWTDIFSILQVCA